MLTRSSMLVVSALLRTSLACTSLMVGPKASADGNAWVAQSDDGEGAGDPRGTEWGIAQHQRVLLYVRSLL